MLENGANSVKAYLSILRRTPQVVGPPDKRCVEGELGAHRRPKAQMRCPTQRCRQLHARSLRTPDMRLKSRREGTASHRC